MPNEFTSNYFAEKFKALGGDQYTINKGVAADFLRKHARNNGSRRLWTKYVQNNQTTSFIDDAIKVLKNAGYKVFKPVQSFEEVL